MYITVQIDLMAQKIGFNITLIDSADTLTVKQERAALDVYTKNLRAAWSYPKGCQ